MPYKSVLTCRYIWGERDSSFHASITVNSWIILLDINRLKRVDGKKHTTLLILQSTELSAQVGIICGSQSGLILKAAEKTHAFL